MVEPIKIKSETVRFTVDLDHDLHRELKQMALNEGLAATELARYALRKLIAERLNRQH
jgi:hypothetical protein